MAPRGRKPKPTNLKLVEGNPGKRALTKDEPEPEQVTRVPAPPKRLSTGAKAVWREEAPALVKMKLLSVADLRTFGNYCELQSRFEFFHRRGVNARDLDKMTKFNRAAVQCEKEARLLAASFGLEPSSRTRIRGSAETPELDEVDELLNAAARLKGKA